MSKSFMDVVNVWRWPRDHIASKCGKLKRFAHHHGCFISWTCIFVD